MRITQYDINTSKIENKISIACVSDLHGRKYEKVIDALIKTNADIILLAGDILEVSNSFMSKRNANAVAFLEQAVKIAPVYYCFGNHEIYYSHTRKEENRISEPRMLRENLEKISSFGIHLVNDSFLNITLGKNDEIFIGGVACGEDMNPALNKKTPDISFIDKYSRINSFKILLCHYPHYYEPYLKNTDFDLIISGHAHGGQWRFFGQGIYAPHQGLFPKYTSGIYDGRFIISRGAVNNTRPIPRLFNPTEILKINIIPNRIF